MSNLEAFWLVLKVLWLMMVQSFINLIPAFIFIAVGVGIVLLVYVWKNKKH